MTKPASNARDKIAPPTRRAEAAAPVRRMSKADAVYGDIRAAILSGELAPGSAIDKEALCQRLGMSRFPVTTAINRLAFERLVLIEPQHGSFVAKISAEDVREYMLVRRALESEIAGEAAGLGDAAFKTELDRNLRYQKAAAEARDVAGFYALDIEFHRLILDSVKLAHAREILDGLRAHLERVRRMLLTPAGRLPRTYKEHAAIARAIAAGQPETARTAMRTHLEETTRFFESFTHDHPDLFAA